MLCARTVADRKEGLMACFYFFRFIGFTGLGHARQKP